MGPAGRALWDGVQDWLATAHPDGRLVLDAHEAAVLAEACGVADRLAALRAVLDGANLATDAAAVRLLAEERMQRAALAQLLLVRLGLPSGIAEATAGKGSTSTSRRAQTAAQSRWGTDRGRA